MYNRVQRGVQTRGPPLDCATVIASDNNATDTLDSSGLRPLRLTTHSFYYIFFPTVSAFLQVMKSKTRVTHVTITESMSGLKSNFLFFLTI